MVQRVVVARLPCSLVTAALLGANDLHMVQRAVVGRLPCSLVTAALLGAYMVQSELGDYDAREFGRTVDYLRQFEFAPTQSDELLSKVQELHQTLT